MPTALMTAGMTTIMMAVKQRERPTETVSSSFFARQAAAVAMAAEMRDGVPVGSRTGAMVAEWSRQWPRTAEDAVAVARELLLNPGKLKEALGQRLFGKNPGEEGA